MSDRIPVRRRPAISRRRPVGVVLALRRGTLPSIARVLMAIAVLGLAQENGVLLLSGDRVLRLSGIPIPLPLETRSICRTSEPLFHNHCHRAQVELDLRYIDAEVLRSADQPVQVDIGGEWEGEVVHSRTYLLKDGLIVSHSFQSRIAADDWQVEIAERIETLVLAARQAYQVYRPEGPPVEVVSL